MAKKTAKKEVVEELLKDEEVVAETFTEKVVARRGKSITLRTYSDGRVEEL